MSLPNAFDPAVTAELLGRLDQLRHDAQPRWDGMDAVRMVAHCAEIYEHLASGAQPRLPLHLRLLNRWVFKWKVVSEHPYSEAKPAPAAPVDTLPADLARECARLRAQIEPTHALGAKAFEGRVHPLFGPLSSRQWSNLFWKHLDHHFRQFGV
ncbi:MAG TPA: DUF1569 domain-containing protein [Holophagaceae bacterium]|nr:DUF1569 domain-containing protein [Holophagaceae bacterium]